MQITQEEIVQLAAMCGGFGPVRIAAIAIVTLKTCNAIKAGDTTQYALSDVMDTVSQIESILAPVYQAQQQNPECNAQGKPIEPPPVVEPPPETPTEPPVEPPVESPVEPDPEPTPEEPA